MASYPEQREADVALRDGSTVRVRPVRPDDRLALRSFLGELSDDSRAFRFFSSAANIDRAADWASDVDYQTRYGLLALRGPGERVVGHASYVGTDDGRAEVAFAVVDQLQGKGLGTILLAHLAEAASEAGIALFEAEVLTANHRMVEVFRESGFPVEISSAPGSIHVELPTSLSADARERFENRDRIAAAAAVRRFLEPRSVAVIGASRERGSVGGEIFHNLLEAGFEGVVYPVNPAAEVVQSVRSYPSISEVPGNVDLAIIAVPSAAVGSVAQECAARSIPAVVVVSAGFAEVGPDGQDRQRELVQICRGAGVRLIGPNCLGIVNTRPETRLNATFAPAMPPAGNVGFLSQSGALGLAFIDLASDRSLGLSSFASIGNRADITGNDLLEYWEEDPETDVALLYIESFSDPRRFSRVARRVGRSKPVVVVKSGRSQAGARATSSHTGALLAASDVTVDALFEQAGVTRTDTLGDMLDVASLLANQPLPAGPRVAIVTNAGGPGIMCADACEAAGLEIPPLPDGLRDELRAFLAPEAGLGNPVDMIATATADQYRRTIAGIAAWDGVDALIVIFVRPLLTKAEDVAAAVREAVDDLSREVPVQAVFMSERDHAAMVRDGGIPTYLYPEDAARALARVMRHVHWRERPLSDPPSLSDLRGDEAAAIIADALGRGAGWLSTPEVMRLMNCYGIPVAEWEIAPDAVTAGHIADRLGGRVALKAVGPQLLHKSELGAVRTDLHGGAEVSWAAVEMDEALAREDVEREHFVVQSMVASGVEMIVGVVGDALFGPVVACGAGGVQAELLKDVSVRISPISRGDASEMIRSLATYPLLTGYRGSEAADVPALEDVVLRTSAMVEAHHEIAELDLNPVVATADGAIAVDARVRVEVAPPSRPWPSAYAGAGA
jgi:acetyl coenzyme A synthetase (ADP forming)-like protein